MFDTPSLYIKQWSCTATCRNSAVVQLQVAKFASSLSLSTLFRSASETSKPFIVASSLCADFFFFFFFFRVLTEQEVEGRMSAM